MLSTKQTKEKNCKKFIFYNQKNPRKFITTDKLKEINTNRMICDFIAGMTDRYAINLYNRIK